MSKSSGNYPSQCSSEIDVVVVGAGMGGIYAVKRLRDIGLSVIGLEGASGVGGVWYHNNYPGARVDVESDTYCYLFDTELYSEWRWSERYATQAEILQYLNHVADKYDVKSHFHFCSWLIGATWQSSTNRYEVETSNGDRFYPRFLVMATGQLSRPKEPEFPGFTSYEGEWVQTSKWPAEGLDLRGRRVGVIGTGSSGVQVSTAVAEEASHLYVFQRTPNYSVPSGNRPSQASRHKRLSAKTEEVWDELLNSVAGLLVPPPAGKADDFTEEQRYQLLEERYAFGGQSLLGLFEDQGTDWEVNRLVSDFVRDKIRARVRDVRTAERLIPTYPMGTRRLCLDAGYYEMFNRPDVTLVDLRESAIEGFDRRGVVTSAKKYDLDVVIFALGFDAFTGALDQANIRNDLGQSPSARWGRGPKTYLGIMTHGFPNLFMLTGPGSPSVLANVNVASVQQVDFVGGLMEFMKAHSLSRVEATEAAESVWCDHVQEVASDLIRLQVDNYMVHKNADDGSRVFIPYAGGLARYVGQCRDVAAKRYEGFTFAGSSNPSLRFG